MGIFNGSKYILIEPSSTSMKITIITSCTKAENLPKLFDSIDFQYVEKWIIIYDTSHVQDKGQSYTWKYKNDIRILEAECPFPGVLGYAQKNFGLKFVNKGLVYFLDDDTIMHPDFWKVLPSLNEDLIYVFDQESYLDIPELLNGTFSEMYEIIALQKRGVSSKIFKGNPIHPLTIHTGMFIVPYKYITTQFVPHIYISGGVFLKYLYEDNKSTSNISYIHHTLSYGKMIY